MKLNKKLLKRLVPALTVFIVSAFAIIFNPSSAFAETSIQNIKDKYIARGLYICYSQYMEPSLNPAEIDDYEDIFKDDKAMKDNIVGLAPGTLSNDVYSCSGLYDALGFDHDFSYLSNGSYIPDTSGNKKRLTTLGYVADKSGGTTEKNVAFKIGTVNASGAGSITTVSEPELSMSISNGKVSKINETSPTGNPAFKIGLSGGNDFRVYVDNGSGSGEYYTSLDFTFTPNTMTAEELVENLASKFEAFRCVTSQDSEDGASQYMRPNSEVSTGYCYVGKGSIKNSGANTSVYKLEEVDKKGVSSDINASYKVAYKNLTKKEWPGDTVTKEEQAALYQDILLNYYGGELKKCVDKKNKLVVDETFSLAPEDQVGGWHEVKLYKSDGKVQYCYIGLNNDEEREVYGIMSPARPKDKTSHPAMADGGSRINALDIIKWLNKNAPNSIDSSLASDVQQNQPNDGTNDPQVSCHDEAGALGWIICSVIDALEGATTKLYDEMIEPALEVKSEFFDIGNEGGEGVYAAWKNFQTFANIAFAIMLLVVIISQLTGVGINNYGIKNILPRLIVAVILINLSFVICTLLVDVSNILGVSLKGLFDGMASKIPLDGNGSSGYDVTSFGVDSGAFIITVVIGIFAATAIWTSGLAVILPLLLGLLSAFIAVFFLFLLLGARQAGVVILTVISPLAVVCYMLPNTKKYFDRWKTAFLALLTLFPICGIMIGGGNFAGRVLLSVGADNFFFQLSAMLACVVPFFFIPTVLRSSMSALGNIGNTISGFGKKLSNRTTSSLDNRARNSERFKNYQEQRAQAVQRRRAGVGRDGQLTRRGQRMRERANREGNFLTRGMHERARLRIADAETGYLKNEMRTRNAELATRLENGTSPRLESARAGMEEAELAQQVKEQTALLNQPDANGVSMANDGNRLRDEHRRLLSELNTDPGNATNQARLRAVQDLLSTTDRGRTDMRNNFDDAINAGQTRGIAGAANHLVNQHMGDIQKGGRNFRSWALQASSGNFNTFANHALEGVGGYTAQALADTDDATRDDLIRAYQDGSMEGNDRAAFERAVWELANNQNINVKEDVRNQLQTGVIGHHQDTRDNSTSGASFSYAPAPNQQDQLMRDQADTLHQINDALQRQHQQQQQQQQQRQNNNNNNNNDNNDNNNPFDGQNLGDDMNDYLNGNM